MGLQNTIGEVSDRIQDSAQQQQPKFSCYIWQHHTQTHVDIHGLINRAKDAVYNHLPHPRLGCRQKGGNRRQTKTDQGVAAAGSPNQAKCLRGVAQCPEVFTDGAFNPAIGFLSFIW